MLAGVAADPGPWPGHGFTGNRPPAINPESDGAPTSIGRCETLTAASENQTRTTRPPLDLPMPLGVATRRWHPRREPSGGGQRLARSLPLRQRPQARQRYRQSLVNSPGRTRTFTRVARCPGIPLRTVSAPTSQRLRTPATRGLRCFSSVRGFAPQPSIVGPSREAPRATGGEGEITSRVTISGHTLWAGERDDRELATQPAQPVAVPLSSNRSS